MEKAVSAADANRRFSELLRGVRGGESFIVTAHGKPVARIAPVAPQDRFREAARATLFARLRQQTATDIGPWSRAEIYER